MSITEARAIALKAHPGKITDEELEKEKGGTGLRYSFDIKRGTVTQEVGVDAQTGKVLEKQRKAPTPTSVPASDLLNVAYSAARKGRTLGRSLAVAGGPCPWSLRGRTRCVTLLR